MTNFTALMNFMFGESLCSSVAIVKYYAENVKYIDLHNVCFVLLLFVSSCYTTSDLTNLQHGSSDSIIPHLYNFQGCG